MHLLQGFLLVFCLSLEVQMWATQPGLTKATIPGPGQRAQRATLAGWVAAAPQGHSSPNQIVDEAAGPTLTCEQRELSVSCRQRG